MDDTEQPEVDEQAARLAQANKLFQTGVMLIYGKRKSVEKAIKCIQRAIVLNDSDYKYWQLLGEAYYQRGSLNPAINCFMKSLTLAELDQDEQERTRVQADSTYSRLRVSDIRLSVQHLDDAVSGYSEIINFDPSNVAALVGMAKAELLNARRSFHNGLVLAGHSHCMSALKFALRAIKLKPYLCFTWKLASDCCLIQILFGQRGEFATRIDVPEFLSSDEGGLVVTRLGCIEMARQFLCKALTISSYEKSSCLWHNLGISLYLKSIFPSLKQEERESLLKRALKCLLKALDSDRTNSQIRNSIGIVAYHLNLLNTSQNYLIRSIQTNMSTSEIQFSNLGCIFLQKGEFRLASVAFKRCQAEEPLYCRSWLGNALVNDQNSLDNMSYLRHCYKLESNYEAQLMYATKIASLPQTEEYKKDLVSALDCMKRIVNYDERSVVAQNTLGLLLERANFSEQAKRCFDTAYRLAPNDSRVIFNSLRQMSCSDVDCVKGEPQAGAQIAGLVKAAEKLACGNNSDYMLNFIYYLFRNQDYRNINMLMTKVIEKLPNSDVRNKISAQILLAMTERAGGSEYKSWLFKNIIDSEGSDVCIELMINLFALQVFGSVENEQNLVDQVTRDLAKCVITYLSKQATQFQQLFYSLEGLWLRLILASSISRQQDQNKLLRTMVALFPMVAELWLFWGLSLMFQKQKYQTAIFCITRANLISSKNADLTVVCDILLSILLANSCAKQTKSPNKIDRVQETSIVRNHLSRALCKCPIYQLLWKYEKETKATDTTRGTLRKNQVLAGQDLDLLQLAIDHTIKMITS